MISVVTYGRNDNYGYNLHKRTACGFNCMAEVLAHDDEILFVDYNTADHLPTLPEYIWDTLSEKALRLLKVIRVSAEVHAQIKGNTQLSILENVSRNAAIVRSNPLNRWILSTNPDVILILAQRWKNLAELLSDRAASFYEMPRFDIPESVWSSLSRMEPTENMQVLRNWLISNGAAVAETVPDYRFQKFFLFDAPGDFQLAPRDYFWRLRGFDESMNQYLHSDSNLAKRMWLLNGRRTDHLLGDLWVAHQDHYLSGEWAKNARTITHNDYILKVLHQEEFEANDDGWGLQNVELPMFSLEERFKRPVSSLPLSPRHGDLPLSQEINWDTQPYYRLSHYDPEVLAVYLREVLQVMPPECKVSYLGNHASMLDCVRRVWKEVHPRGIPVQDLADASDLATPDVLLVDFYHQRSPHAANRIRLLRDKLDRQLQRGAITPAKVEEELAIGADSVDAREHRERLLPLWAKSFPLLQIQPGTHVILLGCNTGVGIFHRFREFFADSCSFITKDGTLSSIGRGYRKLKSRMTRAHDPRLRYFHHLTPKTQRLLKPLKLRYLYMHHRLVVMVADIQ